MNAYVGMDVHRKRSQIAIMDAAGVQQRNRNLAYDPASQCPDLVSEIKLAQPPLSQGSATLRRMGHLLGYAHISTTD